MTQRQGDVQGMETMSWHPCSEKSTFFEGFWVTAKLQSPELPISLVSLKRTLTEYSGVLFFYNGVVFWLMTGDSQIRREKSHFELCCRPVEIPEPWFSISEVRGFTHFLTSFCADLSVTARFFCSKWCKAAQVLQCWVWNLNLCGPSSTENSFSVFFPFIYRSFLACEVEMQ